MLPTGKIKGLDRSNVVAEEVLGTAGRGKVAVAAVVLGDLSMIKGLFL
jgi:hypothetical protein